MKRKEKTETKKEYLVSENRRLIGNENREHIGIHLMVNTKPWIWTGYKCFQEAFKKHTWYDSSDQHESHRSLYRRTYRGSNWIKGGFDGYEKKTNLCF